MKSINSNLIPLRLKPDDDLKIKLKEFCVHNNIDAGFVISGIGSLKAVRLRLANSKDILTRNEFFEILSLQGSISKEGLHLHVSIADSKGHVLGGHLIEGSLIYTTAEILLAECSEYEFSRSLDSSTGFQELQIYKKS